MPMGVYKKTDEHKLKLRDAQTGKKLSNVTKNKIRNAHLGKRKSMSHCKNIKLAKIGTICTNETRRKIRDTLTDVDHNGVPTKIKTVHAWIRRMYGYADHCENIKCTGKSKCFEWSNKNHKYDSLDRKDWRQMCRICHTIYDINVNNKKVAYYYSR